MIEIVRNPNRRVIVNRQEEDEIPQTNVIQDEDGNTLVSCDDGTSQEIYPTVLEPETVAAPLLSDFFGTAVRYQSEGFFVVEGLGLMVESTFNIDTQTLEIGEQVAASLEALDEERLLYRIQQNRLLIETVLQVQN